MKKQIKDFPDYYITTDGKIISYKFKTPRIMKTWFQKSGYENIKLNKNGISYHFLVHRLVAEAFIPNDKNLPEVNHKDKNRANNNVSNLEWCNRVDNLYDSYTTLSPTRNFKECSLYRKIDNIFIDNFHSIKDAAEYAHAHFECSISGMRRNYYSNGYYIKFRTCND